MWERLPPMRDRCQPHPVRNEREPENHVVRRWKEEKGEATGEASCEAEVVSELKASVGADQEKSQRHYYGLRRPVTDGAGLLEEE